MKPETPIADPLVAQKNYESIHIVLFVSLLSIVLLLPWTEGQATDDDSLTDHELASDSKDNSAAGFLRQGFDFAQNGRLQEAQKSFEAALHTQTLNEAGESLAYWYIYNLNQAQNHSDDVAESLENFVTTAEGLLHKYSKESKETSGLLNIERSFIEQFDLKQKLSRSRAMLSAMWIQKNAYYGKTVDRAIVIQDQIEKVYFLELAPACDPQKNQTRHYITQKEQQTTQGRLEEISIVCDNNQTQKTQYFLQIAPSRPSNDQGLSAQDLPLFKKSISQDDQL